MSENNHHSGWNTEYCHLEIPLAAPAGRPLAFDHGAVLASTVDQSLLYLDRYRLALFGRLTPSEYVHLAK